MSTTDPRHLLLRVGPIALRPERRAVAASVVLVVALSAVASVALLLGDYPLSPAEVFRALAGALGDPVGAYFVRDIRMPRVLAAILVGAALGASGSVFQRLSGNPLGSPDVIGFTTGSATGALLQIVLFGGGPGAIAIGALVGGFGAAAVVYLLAWREGLSGFRLVLVGIGIAAVLQGANSLLVVRASLDAAQTAVQWLAGSLSATTWVEVGLLTAALAVLMPVALLLSRPLGAMGMGDDLAAGIGVPLERTRLWLVVTGVALVAVATSATGPIAFVALAAPQLWARLSRTSQVGLGPSALMGALLVLVSDVAAQRIFAPTQLPVGVVTGAVGGIYLVWLLSHEWRRRRG